MATQPQPEKPKLYAVPDPVEVSNSKRPNFSLRRRVAAGVSAATLLVSAVAANKIFLSGDSANAGPQSGSTLAPLEENTMFVPKDGNYSTTAAQQLHNEGLTASEPAIAERARAYEVINGIPPTEIPADSRIKVTPDIR